MFKQPRLAKQIWISSTLGLCTIVALSGCNTNQSQPQLDSATRTPSSSPAITAPLTGRALGETTVADIASEAVKSVVNIDTSTSVTLPDSGYGLGLPRNEFEFFFGPGATPYSPNRARKLEKRGTGSGVIIKPNGYILTNNHVVGEANDIKVTLNDKRVFKGKVIGRDTYTDLALIKIAANDLPTAKLGSAKDLRPGEWAIAIGSPVGLSHTVTLGIISAIGRSLDTRGIHSDVGLIQTDAAINPGNSGGPLLNIHGEVIGINTAIRADAQNIGFAIPVDVANQVGNDLLATGEIKRPYVGIYMGELTPELAKALGLTANSRGVVVAKVAPDSPAEKSGLVEGDVIEKVEGKSVETPRDVQQLVRAKKPGDKIPMLIARAGQIRSVNVAIGDYPEQQPMQE